ncbi:MAG: cytochrome c family protein [Steroidobacteraceae bacterium]
MCRSGVLRSSALTLGALCAAALPVVSGFAADAPSVVGPFAQCSVCHSTDGTNGIGPSLKGIFGRRSGTAAGFRYSRAMKSADITWDEIALDRYLADPQGLSPGNVMPFSGVADGPDRAKVIAYLKTL